MNKLPKRIKILGLLAIFAGAASVAAPGGWAEGATRSALSTAVIAQHRRFYNVLCGAYATTSDSRDRELFGKQADAMFATISRLSATPDTDSSSSMDLSRERVNEGLSRLSRLQLETYSFEVQDLFGRQPEANRRELVAFRQDLNLFKGYLELFALGGRYDLDKWLAAPGPSVRQAVSSALTDLGRQG